MTVEEVKADLKEIKYYYAHAKEFENAVETVGRNNIFRKVKKYNNAVCNAAPQLYYVYLGLYINFNTQMVVALDMDYSLGHIKRLNKELYNFFIKEFSTVN